MSPVLAYLREFHYLSAVVRLLLAMLAGGAIGYGRTRKRRSAGMRTYMLTSLGAALTILIAMYEEKMLYGQWLWASEFTSVKFDASRFSAQVISGVGFLAAGTIIGVEHQQVSGLTTAIGLFCSAALGIAAGAGFYECVLIGIPVVVCAIELMRPLETNYKRHLRNITLAVEFDTLDSLAAIRDLIASHGAQVFAQDLERIGGDGKAPCAILTLKMAKEAASHSAMLSALAELPCVYGVQELIA